MLVAWVAAIGEPRLAGQAPEEDARARGLRLTTEAVALAQQNDALSLKRALPLREEALAIFTALGDRGAQAETHHGLGNIHERLNDLPRARAAFEAALAIRRELGDPRGQAETLTRVGALYRAIGERELALDAYTRGLEFARQIGDVRREAVLLNNLGVLYATTDDNARAQEFFAQARHAYKAAGDRRGEAATMMTLASTAIALNDSTTALELYHESLATLREVGDRRLERTALHNIGVAYDKLGDAPRALEFYNRAVALARELGDRRAEASTLSALGLLLLRLGAPRDAADHLGHAVRALDELKIPLEHGRALSFLGRTYQALGDYDAAFAAYQRALPLNRQSGDRQDQAATLKSIGSAYAETGAPARAREHFEEARRLYREAGDANGEADVSAVSARASLREGKLDEALQHIDNALALAESVRASIGVPTFRATFLGNRQGYHQFKIDVLMRLHARAPSEGHATLAFLASERSRARALLDTLSEAGPGARVDGATASRAARVRAEINRKAAARFTAKEPDAKQLDQELDALLREYEILQGRMREARPAYASLSAGLDGVDDLQRLLDPDTALVEYSLGAERSFAWVVTRDGFRAVTLAKAEQIENAVRDYFALVTARPQRALRVRERRAAEALSNLVVAPLGEALRHKRLLVVSDGALHYVPFAALPEPNRRGADGLPLPLVRGHEIVQLPSAAVLARLRDRRANGLRADRTLAVFADPVFGPDDPRVGGSAGSVSQSSSPRGSDVRIPTTDDLLKAMTDTELPRLHRLPASGREADAIAALAGRGDTLRAVGFDAHRQQVLSPALARYRVVHFATHGLLNSRRPELSGLVLSFLDADGRPQEGFLGLSDVHSLQLNAELVVLSACRTALGREVRGEGLIGLTHGFMSAGVPRVVATLWDVQDESTVNLMTRFYRGVLRQGQSPAAALRAAQLAMLRDSRWSDPYYWAAFTLQGDWSAF
jgi:CHAT domain-containing protein/Tfp pilus assembly protein PilF